MTLVSLSAVQADVAEERRAAMRALLGQTFVDAGDPAYALIRHHEAELARTCMELLGYRLEIASTAARAVKMPTSSGLHRPIRVRPASTSGQARPPDEWPTLSDRAAILLFLTLVALERGGAQTAISDLANDVQTAGADADPPIAVDYSHRAERVAFADGLDLLCAWGVLEHVSGSRESYSRRDQGDDEALLTVDRRRLAMLLRDPVGALRATTLEDLLDDRSGYGPTPEGNRRLRAHRLARRLVEDPALVLDDLDEDDRAYFLGQRARIEGALADATGLAVERRAEGTALVLEGRELTDVPFPTNGTVKQAALLLCDVLATAPPERVLPPEAIRDAVRELMARHHAHWQRDPNDPAQLEALTAAVIEVLCALDLASPDAAGLRPRPLCARFRSPDLRIAGGPP